MRYLSIALLLLGACWLSSSELRGGNTWCTYLCTDTPGNEITLVISTGPCPLKIPNPMGP